jgi:hypothetical protein
MKCYATWGTVGLRVNKVTWAKIGQVSEPGRYMFRFGYVTVTADDLGVWKQFPQAEFALVARSSDSAGEEFVLGAFDIGASGEPSGR